MHWQPKRQATLSMTKQIIEWMTQQIESGEWPNGMKLPAQRTFALQLGVNRSTLQEAIEELKADGLLIAKRGAATYVSVNAWTQLLARREPNWQRYIDQSVHKANLKTIQLINEFEQVPTMIRLGTGESSPKLIPSADIQASLQHISLDGHALGYSPPQGSMKLRQAICQHVKKRGIDRTPDNICIVSGALQALQLIAAGLLDPQSIVLQPAFSYLQSIQTFQSFGVNLKQMTNWHEDELLAIKKNRQTMIYTIPTLHNPTGQTMNRAEQRDLMQLAENTRIPILEDDVYGELQFGDAMTALKAQDQHGQVVYVGSLSKTLSPGLRIGWVIAPQPVATRLADIKMQMDYGSSAVSQEIATLWLESGRYEQHIEWLRQQLQRRAHKMELFLMKHFAHLADWAPSTGGFYIWLRFKAPIVTTELFLEMLKKGVIIHPGYVYGKGDQHHMRLSYGYAEQAEWEHALLLLKEAIKK